MPGPTNGLNGGVGGIQPGTHDAGVQNQQPKKAKWGIRDLFSFSPKKLFVAKRPSGTKPAQQAYKTFQQYNIRTAPPKIHLRINSQGSFVTQIHTVQDSHISRASLKQQAAILIDKGYIAQEAERTVKKLSKDSGGSQLAVEEGVAKIPFRDKGRQQWAQWAEQSFLKKGYTPQEARKWSHGLLKEAGTNFKGVEHVVRNTPMTPAMQVAAERVRQAQHQEAVNKASDFNRGVDHFVRLGHSPEVARESVGKAQQHYGRNRAAFHQWVQNAPAVQPRVNPQVDAAKTQYIENALKPWMVEQIKSKGFSAEDAQAMTNNFAMAAQGNVELMISLVQNLRPADQPSNNISEQESLKKDAEALETLGLDKSADLTAIKKAYRKLSLKYHPDKNPSPDASDTFQKISQAHEHLTSKSTTFKPASHKSEATPEREPKIDSVDTEDPFYILDTLRPWMVEELKAKGYSQADAESLSLGYIQRGKGNIEHIKQMVHSAKSASEEPADKLTEQQSREKDLASLQALRLDESADFTAVKKAYRRLSLKFHPDKNSAPDARDIFEKLTEAYAHLENSRTFKSGST